MKKVTKTTEAYREYRFHLVDDRTIVVENFVVDTSRVYDITTEYNATLNMRLETGVWVKRSLAKIVWEVFGRAINERAVRAENDELLKQGLVPTFRSIEEAAWVIMQTAEPTFGGRPVGLKAVSKNITNCLKQPDVYPTAYGYTWHFVNEHKEAY